jgi:hypothetical protein
MCINNVATIKRPDVRRAAAERLKGFRRNVKVLLRTILAGQPLQVPDQEREVPRIKLVIAPQGANTCPICEEVFVCKADPSEQAPSGNSASRSSAESNRLRDFLSSHMQHHQSGAGTNIKFIKYPGSTRPVALLRSAHRRICRHLLRQLQLLLHHHSRPYRGCRESRNRIRRSRGFTGWSDRGLPLLDDHKPRVNPQARRSMS